MKKWLFACLLLAVSLGAGCNGSTHIDYLTGEDLSTSTDIDSIDKLKITNLSGQISQVNSLVKEFDSIKSISYKTEFETDSDFIKREYTFLKNPFFSKKIYTTNVDLKFNSFEKIHYDIYSKRFIFEVQSNSSRIESNFLEYEILPFNIELTCNTKVTGKYTGTNVFGVSVPVTKFKINKTILNIVNKSDLMNSSSTIYINDDLPTKIIGKSVIIEPQEAQRISKSLKIVYEFNPYPHYIDKNKFGVITRNQSYESPTLSSPDDTLINSTVLFINLLAIHLIDSTTGNVYGSEYFY